jgi:hypothetical protein
MPKFTLARFAECEVFFATWDAPKRGDKVGLTLTERGMEVCYSHDQPCDCGYTWPGGDHVTASRKAIKHYERRTGRTVC